MCGLSGIIITRPDLISMDVVKIMFSLLMEENDSRGGHAYGVWGSNLAPLRVLGKFTNSPEKMHEHLKDFLFQIDKPTFLFGHTRFGTHGTNTVNNAHPFNIGNITLAHNGVVDVDGLTSKDHEVDSGQIALAIAQDGWVDGMARVSGSCALLVSVNDVPMVYRHNQMLSCAEFPWGTVICSAEAALKRVVTARLGLTPTKLGDVESDIFCQPGFGPIRQPAPAAAPKPFYSRKDWDDAGYADWGSGNSHFHQRGWGSNRGSTVPRTTPTLGWSGESDLKKLSDKNSKFADASQKVKAKLQRALPLKHEEIIDAEIIDGDAEPTGCCEYCDVEQDLQELSVVMPNWSDEPYIMCIDCIIDEVVDSHNITVLGPYQPEAYDAQKTKPLTRGI